MPTSHSNGQPSSFLGIQPAKLRRQEGTLSFANRSSLDPGHILHQQVTEPQAASKERLKSRRPFWFIHAQMGSRSLSEMRVWR